MVDYRKLLDAVVGAIAKPAHSNQGSGSATPSSSGAQQGGGPLAGQAPDQLLQKAKDLAIQNPKLAQAALVGLAGLLFRGRKKGGLASGLVKLGGLAVIGGLAYRAYQGRSAGAASPDPSAPSAPQTPAAALEARTDETGGSPSEIGFPPETSRFHPVSQTEDDALLFLRTMVAAAAADGQVDASERARIVKGLEEAGVDPAASRWLETEMASPADVEELAALVNDPEKAAQVYSAARIAIDPDTVQEREFLNQLAAALDLEPGVRREIDETAGALK